MSLGAVKITKNGDKRRRVGRGAPETRLRPVGGRMRI